jgi:hypothetical protein
LGLVVEWAAEHRDELFRNWDLIEKQRPPDGVPPLR